MNPNHNPRRVLCAVLAIIFLSSASLLKQAWAQSQARDKNGAFTRPKPTRPFTPAIPSASRYVSDRVFLEKADSLFKVGTDTVERQIVKGDVVFRHGGMWMYCDSAYYYPEQNSMDAFGHVKMVQGDTLFVYSDKLYYDGNIRLARLMNGPSEPKVRLRDPQGTLITDTLVYDLGVATGTYDCGGLLTDDQNTLSSIVGQYFTNTHDAEFFYDVELVNKKDGYRLLSDTLYYNTRTGVARIETPTRIYGKTDTILTRRGWYDTKQDNLALTSRSTIAHKDSNNNVTTLEGDSIVYDKTTRISQAYAFKNRFGRPMVLTDTANKMVLTGLYGLYNDSTRESLATGYPLLREYSRPDTIYLRADTIRTFAVARKVWPDSLAALAASLSHPDPELEAIAESLPAPRAWTARDSLILDSANMTLRDFWLAKAYHNARFFNRDVQGVADSLVFTEADSMLRMFRRPVIWSGDRQVTGGDRRDAGRILVHFNDSTADWALLPAGGLSTEQVDSAQYFYNQLAGKKMKAYFNDQTLRHLDVAGNVQTIFLPQEEDSTYSKLVYAESSYLTVDMKDGDIERLKMWPEVTGSTTPLFLVTPRQKVIEGYEGRLWLPAIRPRGRKEGDTVVWDDDLGEVSSELEQYLNQ